MMFAIFPMIIAIFIIPNLMLINIVTFYSGPMVKAEKDYWSITV